MLLIELKYTGVALLVLKSYFFYSMKMTRRNVRGYNCYFLYIGLSSNGTKVLNTQQIYKQI